MGAIVVRQMEDGMFDWLMQRMAVHRRRRRTTRQASPAARFALDGLDDAPREDGPCGCGWFDSSQDLRAGLVVREQAGADAAAESLGLALWLELHLREWRGANGA